MQIYKKQFAKKLRDALTKANLDQAELANFVGVNASAVSRWVTGRDEPTDDNFKLILKAVGQDESFFIGKESKKQNLKQSIVDSADILSRLANLSPEHRQFVLALIFDDPSMIPEGLEAPNWLHSHEKV